LAQRESGTYGSPNTCGLLFQFAIQTASGPSTRFPATRITSRIVEAALP